MYASIFFLKLCALDYHCIKVSLQCFDVLLIDLLLCCWSFHLLSPCLQSTVAVELLPWASSLDEVCNSVTFTTWLVIPVIEPQSFTCSLNSTYSLVMSQVSVYTKCLNELVCYARFRSCDCLGFTFCRNQFHELGYLEKICTWTNSTEQEVVILSCMHACIHWQSLAIQYLTN